MDSHPKFLDARTKDDMLRLNSFSDDLVDLVNDFRDWIKENSIPDRMLWYADVFNADTLEHLGCLKMTDNAVVMDAPPKGVKVNPFKRRRPLRYWLHIY